MNTQNSIHKKLDGPIMAGISSEPVKYQVHGTWISHLIQLAWDQDIAVCNIVEQYVPTIYSSLINEKTLLNSLNVYSLEFAFLIASICYEQGGKDLIVKAANTLEIEETKNPLPIDFLISVGEKMIGDYLLGAQLIISELGDNTAELEVIYPNLSSEFPLWKEIATIQQENIIRQVLEKVWKLKKVEFELTGKYESDEEEVYGFEYSVSWQGGEHVPATNILKPHSVENLQEYLIEKTKDCYEYLNKVKDSSLNEVKSAHREALSVKSQALQEYNQVKNIVSDQEEQIEQLLRINNELEGMVNFLSQKGDQLEHESNAWKASKVAAEQLKKEAEEMSQMKSRLTSIISHELRTPLSSLLGFTELMLHGESFNAEEVREFMQTIYDESSRMKDLLDEFLDMQRLSSGRVELHMEKCSLHEVFKYLVTSFKGYASGVEIMVDLPKDMPPIHADRSKLEQILRNFVSNAIKYSPHGGEVKLSALCVGNMAQLCVSDQGLGIPEESMAKLFTDFYRVENKEHMNIKGTGLGLAITKQLVEAHNGEVWVESKLNVGSQFYFTIPLDLS